MAWDHEQDKETDKRLKRAQMTLNKEMTLSWEMNYKRCTMYWSEGKLSPKSQNKKKKKNKNSRCSRSINIIDEWGILLEISWYKTARIIA